MRALSLPASGTGGWINRPRILRMTGLCHRGIIRQPTQGFLNKSNGPLSGRHERAPCPDPLIGQVSRTGGDAHREGRSLSFYALRLDGATVNCH